MNNIQNIGSYFNSSTYLDKRRHVNEGTFGEQNIPEWWSSALQRIAFLIELPVNWDSYGAKKIDQMIAYHSIQILQQISRPGIPAPSIVPTVHGRLQFEWHSNGIDLEFEVLSATLISVSYENVNTNVEWDKELDYNLTPLTDVLKLLVTYDEECEAIVA